MSERQQADESLATLPREIAAHLQSLRTNIKAKNATKAEASETPAAPNWETLSGHLRERIGEATFKRWFEPITATLSTDRPYCLRLAFPTRFKRDWVEQNHGDQIRAIWRQLEPEGTLHLATMPQPKKAGEEPKKAQVINLPTFPKETRAVVNEIARSALFAAIQGKDRQLVENAPIPCSGDTKIFFSGRQLNQDDHDVFMQLVSLASNRPAGEYIQISGHSLLKALGRGTSGKEHKQLDAEIERIKNGGIKIKAKGYTYLGNLIHDAIKHEESGHWAFRLNENLLSLYSTNCYTLIDWEQRKKLKGGLTRWVHLWLAGHAHPLPMKVEWFLEKSGSRNKELRDFRRKLRQALDELQAAGHIKAWHIDETDSVHIDRGDAITDSQQRHLTKPRPRRK